MNTSHFSWSINEYILFLIVVIITFLIIDYGLWSRRSETFYNITTTTTIPTTTIPTTTIPATTTPAPRNTSIISNPNDNLFLTDDEKQKWANMWARLDGNEETVPYSSSNIAIQQASSNLYGNVNDSGAVPVNYNVAGSWATVDQLGSSLTDTLGGVNSSLGYTVIQEQLGTFNSGNSGNTNYDNTYDNTQNYNTGVNAANLGGANISASASAAASASSVGSGSCSSGNGVPILLQKDFAGVANIFAPNIYISDKVLNDSGMPNISNISYSV
jgi:hypothetical protein